MALVHYIVNTLLLLLDLAAFALVYSYTRALWDRLAFRLLLALHGLPGELRTALYGRYSAYLRGRTDLGKLYALLRRAAGARATT